MERFKYLIRKKSSGGDTKKPTHPSSGVAQPALDKLPESKKSEVFREAIDKEYSKTIELLSKE